MKVEVNKKEPQFEPIELKITIESEQDLCSLWHRLNVGTGVVDSNSKDFLIYNVSEDSRLWRVLNDLINTDYPHLKKT